MNKEEFQEKVITLSEKMFRLSNRLLNDIELSRDCVQESFLKLWENRNNLEQIKNIQAFAFTMVRNISIDKLRHIKHVNEFSQMAQNPISESNYEFVESRILIKKLIQNLPPQQRLIIELRDIEEFSYEEISDSLNISVNSIRVNLSIARKKIKEELIKIYNYGLTKD